MMKEKLIVLLCLILLVACGGEADTLAVVVPTSISSGSDTSGVPLADNTPIPTESTSTPQPTNQPIDQPTNTPSIEPTPTLASTATPTPNPLAGLPIVDPVAGQLPAISRPLLFRNEENQLNIWRTSGVVETLVEDAFRVVVSTNGRFAVVNQSQNEDNSALDVVAVDLVSGNVQTIAQNVPDGGFAISNSGVWIAFIDGDENHQSIYLAQRGSSDPPRLIYICIDRCFSEIVWHPSNDFFTFSDREALWLYNLSVSEPETLLANDVDENGQSTRLYVADSWAKNGRYLLLWAGAIEGASRILFDVPTGQQSAIPSSFAYVDPFRASVSWMQDDRLLIVRGVEDGQPTIELARFDHEANQRLMVEENANLSESAGLVASGASHLENGRFGYLLTHPTDSGQSGLYILTSLNEQPEIVVQTPARFFPPEVNWSPDGSGALITADSFSFYAPVAGEQLINLESLLGTNIRNISWLPSPP